ncbi:MAG: transcription elongation factor GreA [Kosmotogales bacterium]|mgnify:CR=1 FL=1|nr:transcription elongation factor GreA [Kosmotogales bacterium]
MAKEESILLTKEGYLKLKKELEENRKKLMYDIAQRIKEARELGDLSENSEYDEAKNEQGRINSRIQQLENILNKAQVIQDESDGETVKLGSKLMLFDESEKKELKLTLVNPQEANIFENKISVDSPVGAAVLSRKLNEIIKIKTPSGIKKYKIIGVS